MKLKLIRLTPRLPRLSVSGKLQFKLQLTKALSNKCFANLSSIWSAYIYKIKPIIFKLLLFIHISHERHIET